MKIGAIAAILGGLGLVAVFVISSWISAANFGAEQEAALEAALSDNKQVLANYSNTIGEMAQVPALQRDNLIPILEAAFEGRYGPDGSQAVFQMIQENYPGQLDNTLYQNLQTQMVAGRAEFKNKQTALLDRKRVYITALNKPISGFWLKLAGYPKTDLSKIIAVTNAHSDQAFATGQDNGITLTNPPVVRRQREAEPAAVPAS